MANTINYYRVSTITTRIYFQKLSKHFQWYGCPRHWNSFTWIKILFLLERSLGRLCTYRWNCLSSTCNKNEKRVFPWFHLNYSKYPIYIFITNSYFAILGKRYCFFNRKILARSTNYNWNYSTKEEIELN